MTAKTYNIADLLESVVDKIPERLAAVCGDNRISYRRLDERANQLARHLRRQGVQEGDHVGVYLYNCNEYLEASFACFKLRAVPININYRYVADELIYIFDNADMVACIHGREFIPELGRIRGKLPALRTFVCVDDDTEEDLAAIGATSYEEALAAESPERDFGPRSGDDLFILYTGGTTGMPKGVLWPHKDLFFAGLGGMAPHHPDGPISDPAEVAGRIDPEANPVCASLAPLMHGASWWAACASLLAGRTTILFPGRSFSPEAIWPVISAEKVNLIALVGDAMAIPLLDTLKANPDTWDLSSLFLIGSGGAVFSRWAQEDFKSLLPNVITLNNFGSSETGVQGGDDGKGADGLGRIERSERADVITEDHRFVEPGSGETGFLARSGYTPIGYYGDPEKSAKTFITLDGKRWVMTGDVATVDSDGCIVVFGRGNNCINSGGEKIFPEEVEEAIKSHPAVLDALVVATPDPRFGSKVTAVVSLREGKNLTLAEAMKHCRAYIAGYKVPRELHIADHVQRTPSGKPDYQWASSLALGRTRLVG